MNFIPLYNIGATCYINSIIQLFFNMELLNEKILEIDVSTNRILQVYKLLYKQGGLFINKGISNQDYHKINYNQTVFQTMNNPDTNSFGFYYQPHNKMTLRVFSDYIETGDINFIDQVPSYSFYSSADQQFRWRDLYTYGFTDNLERGVDYPFLNTAHYPFSDITFRLIPEGINYNESLFGVDFAVKPLIDECE